MSHHEKFWEKFGHKIRQYQAAGNPEGEWETMEQLLGKASPPSRKMNRKLLILIPLAVFAGYLAGAWYGFPQVPELGAFPIPISGIAQLESLHFDIDPTQDASSRDKNIIPNQEKTDHLPQTPKVTIGNRPTTYPPRPGTIQAMANHSEQRVPRRVELPDDNTPLEAIRTTTPVSPSDAAHQAMYTPPDLDKRPATLSKLPSKAIHPLTQEPSSSTFELEVVSPEKRIKKLFGGLLLGANLAVINFQEARYSSYPFIGLFTGLKLNSRWAAQAEAHIKYVDNLSVAYETSERLESNNGFFFDQVSSGTVEKNYLAIETPLLVKYTLSPAWNLLAGVRPSLILEDASFSDLYTKNAAFDGISNMGQNNNIAASSKPMLRQFDLGLSVGLEWALHRRWTVDARFTRGLTDLGPSQVGQQNVRHFNTDLQLSIRRKF